MTLGTLRRHPAVHFVVLGGLAFAAQAWMPAGAAQQSRGARTDEQILLDEALAIGLDQKDRLVRDRLAGLARLAKAGAIEDAAALEREARRLGLERHDVVVRRHLVQMMALALAHGGTRRPPADAELVAYLQRHRERFLQPARLQFTHVFFARDRAGTAPLLAARAARAALGTRAPASAAPAVLGDGFLGGSEAAGSEPELSRVFGPAFVQRVAALPIGRWAGPVKSPYGWHVVWLDRRTPERLPSVAAVRSRLVEGVRAEQAAARLERRLAERRARDREGRS